MKYYIKLITGFREDQYVTVPMQEAHKAYYLFRHPEERGVFSNGGAVVGKNIHEIKPDWNATMGWIEHEIEPDDWRYINDKGVDKKMEYLLGKASEAGMWIEKNPELLKMSLGEIIENKLLSNEPQKEISTEVKMLTDKLSISKELNSSRNLLDRNNK